MEVLLAWSFGRFSEHLYIVFPGRKKNQIDVNQVETEATTHTHTHTPNPKVITEELSKEINGTIKNTQLI